MATKPRKVSAVDLLRAATDPVPEPETVAAPEPEAASKSSRRPPPKGDSKQLTLYLEGPAYRQLREIAFNEDTKMHPLILEGLNLLFKSRGRPEIARSK
jgi:hypothetical protein